MSRIHLQTEHSLDSLDGALLSGIIPSRAGPSGSEINAGENSVQLLLLTDAPVREQGRQEAITRRYRHDCEASEKLVELLYRLLLEPSEHALSSLGDRDLHSEGTRVRNVS
jgi:hypothetical protein